MNLDFGHHGTGTFGAPGRRLLVSLLAVLLASTHLVLFQSPADAHHIAVESDGSKYAAVRVHLQHDPSLSSWNYRRIYRTTVSGSKGGNPSYHGWAIERVSTYYYETDRGYTTYAVNLNRDVHGFLGSGTNLNCTASTWSGCATDEYWHESTDWQTKFVSVDDWSLLRAYADVFTNTDGPASDDFSTRGDIRFYYG